MFNYVQQQQQEQKGHLTVNHNLTKRLTNMEINHPLKMKIL